MKKTIWYVIAAIVLMGCGGTEEESTPGPSADLGYDILDFGQRPFPRNQRMDAMPAFDGAGEPIDADHSSMSTDSDLMADAGMMVPDQGMVFDAGVGPGDEQDAEPMQDPLMEIGQDTDGDGLDDGWEQGAGDPERLNWQERDSDGDGELDGREDFDQDGLTALEEQAAGRYASLLGSHRPHPFVPDVLVEVDAMEGQPFPVEAFEIAAETYAVLPPGSPFGPRGIALHFYLDEDDIISRDFGADFGPRQNLLMESGAVLADAPDDFPVSQMVHLVMASRRLDRDTRGGEVVTHATDIDRTGILIYWATIQDVFPRCGLDDPPPVPYVTQTEALGGTIAHEIGHALQLGHDTEDNGGINEYNIMSVPQGCVDTRSRAHGVGNQEVSLGNTEGVSAPRFSLDAVLLMDLEDKLSVDTSRLVDGDDGWEM